MTIKEYVILIASEKQIAFIQKEAGIELKGKHGFTWPAGASIRSMAA